MNNYLYYNTPAEQFQTCYGNIQSPFSSDVTTQLPKNIAAIRAVAALALTGFVAFKLASTVFFWPAVVVGVAYAGWTIYSHLCSKDPLSEAFYKICGGKDKFEQLPEIELEQKPNEKIATVISNLNWDELEHPVMKTKTLDGRNIIIIKGLTRNRETRLFSICQTKGVLAFVEKLGPCDVHRVISNLPELAESIMFAVCFPFTRNTFGRLLCSFSSRSGNTSSSTFCKVYSSISREMGNEFFAQLSLA